MATAIQDLELLEFEAGVNNAPVSAQVGLRGLAAENVVIRPEVVRLLTAGVPEREICASLNVTKQVLHRCMREADFGALFEIEIRRVMRHMSKRKLGKVNYLQLTTSVAMMVDKMRLLRDEPTSIQRGGTLTIIENLTIGLHGRGREASERILAVTQSNEPVPVCQLPQPTIECTAVELEPDHVQPGVEGQ